jgi:adenylate cyclase
MYKLLTFDGLAVEQNGKRLAGPGVHRKSLTILAVLAVEGSVSRERLMALFWPESGAERAKGSLNQALHLLRNHFKTADLLSGTTEIRINTDRMISDAALFKQAMKDCDYEAAARIYSGPFLNGIHLDGTTGFEEWAENHRRDLEKQHMGALENLARTAELNNEHETAVTWWQMLHRTDPYSSRITASLMIALGYTGDRAAALLLAREHQELLHSELGMKPDPAIDELAEQLRSRGSLPRQRFEPDSQNISIKNPADSDPGSVEQVPVRPVQGNAVDGVESGDHQGRSVQTVLKRKKVTALVLAVAVLAGIYMVYVLVNRQNENISSQNQYTGLPFPKVPDKASVAVIPFINLSDDQDQEFFSDGITDEITSSLSRVSGLKVSGRTSAYQFKGINPDLGEIREKLSVAYVLEGSVRKSGSNLRINVQLVSTETGYQLWSEIYEREADDIFRVQEEISREIINAIQKEISSTIRFPGFTGHSPDVQVYELYLRGLYFFNRLQIEQAIRYFEEATQRDPQFARAFAALAQAYTVPTAYSELSPVDSWGRGVEAAKTALRIDPDLADAHSALGWLQMIGLNWDEAEKSLKRGIERDPNAPVARLYYAMYLNRNGNSERSLIELQIARQQDPLSLTINAIYGSVLGDLGHTEEAIIQIRKTFELNDSFPIAHAAIAHIYLGNGQTELAIYHYERVFGIVPTSFYAGYLGHAYARAGREDEARALLSQLLDRAGRGEYISAGAIGWIYLGLDERDEGFSWLEKAVEQRDVFLTIYGILTNKFLSAPYAGDKRFTELRSKAGFSY